MKINAGIKSKEEAARRLANGERFWFDDQEIFFDENKIDPFRYGVYRLQANWDKFSEWQIEARWEDNISEGVWCWVWDDPGERKRLRIVIRYNESRTLPYETDFVYFMHAIPATEEEVMKYVLKQE